MRSTRRATTGRSERPRSTTRSADAVARLAGAGLVGPGIGALRGGPSTSAPDGGLAGGTGGLVIPIALAVVAGLLVGVLLLVMIARRRTRAAASEAAASDETLSGAPGLGSGRDPNLPRWLDPSVTAARFRPDTTTAVRAVAVTTAPPRLPVVFGTPADELAERRRVRYDGVPLLDRPDDVLGRTIGEVDGGDEVELLERGEIWAQVRTPTGATGWLPSMTLSGPGSQIVDAADDPPPEPILPEPPPPSSEAPSLEALLAAVAAQRLSRREPADGVVDGAVEPAAAAPAPPDARGVRDEEDAAPDPSDPPAPARPRSRKPTTRRAAKPGAPGEPMDDLDPKPSTGPGPASPAPTRPRVRTPRGDRPAARHR